MRCTVCGGELQSVTTDLPFKLTDTRIVILKALPVLQCDRCPEYLLDDAVLQRVDQLLAGAAGGSELEVVRYAA